MDQFTGFDDGAGGFFERDGVFCSADILEFDEPRTWRTMRKSYLVWFTSCIDNHIVLTNKGVLDEKRLTILRKVIGKQWSSH